MKTSLDRYTLPARALHWLGAVAIVAALLLALAVPGGPMNPAKLESIDYHRFAGFCVLSLVLLRVLWRLGHRPPPPPQHFSAAEQKLTHAVHALLYLLMIAVPLGGWVFSSAAGLSPLALGGVALPDLLAKQPREVARSIHELHEYGAWTLIGLAALHGAAAVKHHVMDRDGMLRRMM